MCSSLPRLSQHLAGNVVGTADFAFPKRIPPSLGPSRETSLAGGWCHLPPGCPLLMRAKGLVPEDGDLGKDQS